MEIRKSKQFEKWLRKLKDYKARTIIMDALDDLETESNKLKPIRKNIKEYKIHYGPGYRIYFSERKGIMFIILVAGDKSTQDRDIELAEILLEEFVDGLHDV